MSDSILLNPPIVECVKEFFKDHPRRKLIPKSDLEAILDGYGLDYEDYIKDGIEKGYIEPVLYHGPCFRLTYSDEMRLV